VLHSKSNGGAHRHPARQRPAGGRQDCGAAREKRRHTPLGADAARVRGIEWYLNTHHALRRLGWFEGSEQTPRRGQDPETTLREILAALSLRPDIPQSADVI